MRIKRLSGLLVCLFLVVCLFSVGSVFGTQTMSYDYSTNNNDWTMGSALDYGVVQAVTGNGRYVLNVTVWIKNATSALTQGEFTGVIMSGKVGNGTRIENSSNIIGDVVVNSPTYVAVTFLFSGNTQLTLGQTFYVGFVVSYPLSSNVKVGQATGASGFNDKSGLSQSWGDVSCSLACTVWTSTVAGEGSATAAPGGSLPPDGSWFTGAGAAELFAWVAVLLLMLVPTFILGVYMRGGKWGFLIGLAVGTGLSYFVFPAIVPVWLVVLVALGLGAAFLTSVKGGG